MDALKEIFGAGLTEYPNSGHINDVYVVTNDGVKIFVENVWTATRTHFEKDLNILHRSDANVKLLIVNPDILGNEELTRSYEKTKMSEREKGIAISDMIDGSRILSDPDFVNNNFRKTVQKLVTEIRERNSRARVSVSPEKPKKIVYCTSCGEQPGKTTECSGMYAHHNFVSGTGTIYCTSCGEQPGKTTECSGMYAHHNFVSD